MSDPPTHLHGTVSSSADPSAPEGTSTAGSGSSITWRSFAVVAIVLALGVGGTVLTLTMTGGEEAPSASREAGRASVEGRTATSDPEELVSAGFQDLPALPAEAIEAPATDPASAVEGFLAAEARNDLEASFEFLSSDEQAIYGSAAGWVAAHADVLPPVTGFEIGEITGEADVVRVGSVVGFVPSLDEIVGLVPARAEVAWAVTRGGGTYGVSLEDSSFAPVYIDDDDAAAATHAWIVSRQDCRSAGEWGGTLLGVRAPARALCDSPGIPEVGTPAPLPQLEATPFIGAFGEEVLTWARVVDVSVPVEMRVVLAPVGTQWQVIGVLAPGAVGGNP